MANKKEYAALVSSDGVFVNLNLEEAEQFWIYDISGETPLFLENRPYFDTENTEDSAKQITESLQDCSYLLLSGLHPDLRKMLETQGLKVFVLLDYVCDALEEIKLENISKPSSLVSAPKARSACGGKRSSCPWE